jgi:site-specific DNA-methyltransferase (adenine-specific)/modification methylase
VAAMMEGRNFVGIEKNDDTELFKGDKIDYIERTRTRLFEVWKQLEQEKARNLRAYNLIAEFNK